MYVSQVVFLSTVLSITTSVTGQQRDCSGHVLVTLNRGYEPFWYQKNFDACIDGNKIKEISVYTLTFSEGYNVNVISNFPLIQNVFLDKSNLRIVPTFSNLPKIEKISMSYNNIETINKNQLSQLPVTELVFSSNKISNIEDGAFGNNVETLFLTCNNLTVMSSKWFTNPAKLAFLNMGGNQLTSIPEDMFKDFVNLAHLELRNNQLQTIGAGSFSGPTNMSYLHFGYNMLTDIKPNVIGNKLSVRNMDIQYNRLSFLREGLMDKLNVSNLRIWGNPWQCPCRDEILNWIEKNNNKLPSGIPRDEDPNCVYALSFQRSCVPFVDDELYRTFLMNFDISPVQFC